LRPIIIFLTLVLIVTAIFQLSRLAEDWHYVVPAQPGELLYVAAFEDTAADWEQFEGQLSSQVTNGALRLAVNTIGEGIYSAASPYFGDFDLQVTTHTIEDALESGFGVIFRQRDQRSYYLFLISADGFYRVSRVVDNRPRDLSAWHTSPLIQQGTGAVNTMRVIGYNDRFQFFINNQQIDLCIPDDADAQSTPLASGECLGGTWQDTLIDNAILYGRVGVAAQTDPVAGSAGIVVDFDNVIIYGPHPIDEGGR
jgi:hypothetical protein